MTATALHPVRATPAGDEGSDARCAVLLYLAARPNRTDNADAIAARTGIPTRALNTALRGLEDSGRIKGRIGDHVWTLSTPSYAIASLRLQQHCAAARAAAATQPTEAV